MITFLFDRPCFAVGVRDQPGRVISCGSYKQVDPLVKTFSRPCHVRARPRDCRSYPAATT